MEKALLAVLAVVTVLSASGCASVQARKTLESGDPCSSLAAATQKAAQATTDAERKAAQAAYDQAAQTCKAALAQEGVDPCLAAEQLASYARRKESNFIGGPSIIGDAQKDVAARCAAKSYYKNICADAGFFHAAAQAAERQPESRTWQGQVIPARNSKGGDIVAMWRAKEMEANKGCNGSGDIVSWGFTGEFNNRCSEHNGLYHYRQIGNACGDLRDDVRGDVITAILGYSNIASNQSMCDTAKRSYQGWFNDCAREYGGVTDPLDDSAAAKERREIAEFKQKSVALGTVCSAAEGDPILYIANNVTAEEEYRAAGCTADISKLSGGLHDSMEANCNHKLAWRIVQENACLLYRAKKYDPQVFQGAGSRNIIGGGDFPCKEEMNESRRWLDNPTELYKAQVRAKTCGTNYYKGVIAAGKAKAGNGTAETEADRLKRENVDLEKQLKALQGGK